MTALAHAVVRITGSASKIEHQPRSGADVDLRVPSTDKATNLLGFSAEIDLDEGIRRTADWVRMRDGR
jgi:UDP-glucose 4-epimerase